VSPDKAKVSARDLLNSSEQLRSDLLSAVAKLDSYIEQLKQVTTTTTTTHSSTATTTATTTATAKGNGHEHPSAG
jgi:hypothetical protein